MSARVSTDAQEARGTIGSQLALLREGVAQEGHGWRPNMPMTASPARVWIALALMPYATPR